MGRQARKPVELTDPQELWMQLGTMQAILSRARQLELARIGITTDQSMILFTLKTFAGPAPIEEVARMMHRAPRILSTLVRRMEVNGLVRTTRNLKKPQQTRVSLTKAGEEAYYRWLGAMVVPNEAWSCLAQEERDMLRTITRKLRDKGIELLARMDQDPYNEPLFW